MYASGYTLNGRLSKFADGSDVGVREREREIKSMRFGTEQQELGNCYFTGGRRFRMIIFQWKDQESNFG